jgi:hypothetical protein
MNSGVMKRWQKFGDGFSESLMRRDQRKQLRQMGGALADSSSQRGWLAKLYEHIAASDLRSP